MALSSRPTSLRSWGLGDRGADGPLVPGCARPAGVDADRLVGFVFVVVGAGVCTELGRRSRVRPEVTPAENTLAFPGVSRRLK